MSFSLNAAQQVAPAEPSPGPSGVARPTPPAGGGGVAPPKAPAPTRSDGASVNEIRSRAVARRDHKDVVELSTEGQMKSALREARAAAASSAKEASAQASAPPAPAGTQLEAPTAAGPAGVTVAESQASNAAYKTLHSKVHFRKGDAGEVIVQVVNRSTGEIVREIPTKQLKKNTSQLDQLGLDGKGLLFEEVS